MIYEYICDGCDETFTVEAPAFTPPVALPVCYEHGGFQIRRLFGAHIDTTGCKDHSYIPEKDRVFDPHRTVSAAKQEHLFHERIKKKRKEHRDGGNRGSFRHSYSVPADLHHGKIRETGDKNYWDDPKNMKRHSDCRVDK